MLQTRPVRVDRHGHNLVVAIILGQRIGHSSQQPSKLGVVGQVGQTRVEQAHKAFLGVGDLVVEHQGQALAQLGRRQGIDVGAQPAKSVVGVKRWRRAVDAQLLFELKLNGARVVEPRG